MSKGTWEETKVILEQGGADGMTRFIELAEAIYINSGLKPLHGWASSAFKLLPEEEQALLVASWIVDSCTLRNIEAKEKKLGMKL